MFICASERRCDLNLGRSSDPNNEFLSYEVFTNSMMGPGFTPIASVSPYLTTTYTHAGAGANSQPIFYYVLTKYNNSGISLSAPLDTFSTIYLTVTNPGSPYGTLNYNAIHNPLPGQILHRTIFIPTIPLRTHSASPLHYSLFSIRNMFVTTASSFIFRIRITQDVFRGRMWIMHCSKTMLFPLLQHLIRLVLIRSRIKQQWVGM